MAQISSMVSVATNVGTSRVIAGKGITNPTAEPGLDPESEKRMRRAIVKTALDALKEDVTKTKVYETVAY